MSYYPHDEDDGAGPAIAMLLLGVWILLMFAGCDRADRPLTPAEQRTFEARIWREAMGRTDTPPAVRWRSDLGCDGSDVHWRSADDGQCVIGEYSSYSDTIDLAVTSPVSLCHEYAHAALWRDRKDIAISQHHWDDARSIRVEIGEFAWIRIGCEQVAWRILEDMGL